MARKQNCKGKHKWEAELSSVEVKKEGRTQDSKV